MIDHFGKRICVGWSAHEILWVEAARTLPGDERPAAFKDIAGMTGRSYYAVQRRGFEITQTRKEAAIRHKLIARTASVFTSPAGR